jgi:hypothetical protein
MDKDIERIHMLLLKGYCCAQVMAILGLEALDEENPQLIDSMSALCLGVRGGLTCGALSGAACMLALFDKNLANKEMIPELVDWFKEVYAECYGSVNCDDILQNNMANRSKYVPSLLKIQYLKAKEILFEHGFDFRCRINPT